MHILYPLTLCLGKKKKKGQTTVINNHQLTLQALFQFRLWTCASFTYNSVRFQYLCVQKKFSRKMSARFKRWTLVLNPVLLMFLKYDLFLKKLVCHLPANTNLEKPIYITKLHIKSFWTSDFDKKKGHQDHVIFFCVHVISVGSKYYANHWSVVWTYWWIMTSWHSSILHSLFSAI